MDYSALRRIGDAGHYWSGTVDIDNAYNLDLTNTESYTSYYFVGRFGFSLRCLSSLPCPSGRGRK